MTRAIFFPSIAINHLAFDSLLAQKLDVNYDKRLAPPSDGPVLVTVAVPLMILLNMVSYVIEFLLII